jgi:hypothetical protein
VVKKFSNTNKQAPTRKQIDAYVAARNEEFESKVKELKQQLKAHESKLEELREKKSRLDEELQLSAESIKQMSNKVLFFEDLVTKFEGAKKSLSASKVVLRSLELESLNIANEIKRVEKELEALGDKFFKKQLREKCESQIGDLKNQRDQIDSQKISQANSIQTLQQLVLEYGMQIKLRSSSEKSKKDIQNLEGKINAEEKAINLRQKDLRDLKEEFRKENLLDESLLVLKATEFTVKQRQRKSRQKKLNENKLSKQIRMRQLEIKKVEKNIQALELFIAENQLPKLERQLSSVKSAAEKLEDKCTSIDASISRWIKNKVATDERFHRKYRHFPLKNILQELKSNNLLHLYLPLFNMDAKQNESKKELFKKRSSVLFIENRKKHVKQSIVQLAQLRRNLVVLEKFEARLSSGSKGPTPKMAIENWSDAELFAEKYMKWLGFTDARRTGAGADEGKDVDSRKAIAQVKDMGTGASRPMLQQLNGVAAAERKIPLFFARSYATTAKEWGEKHGIALFQFSLRGEVKAISKKAKELLKDK